MNPKTKNILSTSIKTALVIAVLYFVSLKLNENWNEVINYQWTIKWDLLLLSVGLHLFTFLLFSRVWCSLMKGFGHSVPLKYAFKISYLSNLGRYIPGRFFQVIGMVYIAKQINIEKEVAVASWGIALMFALPASFLAGFTCILFLPEIYQYYDKLGYGIYLITSITFIASMLIILKPNLSLKLYNYVLKFMNKPAITFDMPVKDALKIYLGYYICWIVYGVSFWLFVISITTTEGFPILGGVAAFVIAYQVCYLAMFTPGGLGVRELAMITIITPYFGVISSGIAIASRIWNLLVEILAATIAFFIKIKK